MVAHSYRLLGTNSSSTVFNESPEYGQQKRKYIICIKETCAVIHRESSHQVLLCNDRTIPGIEPIYYLILEKKSKYVKEKRTEKYAKCVRRKCHKSCQQKSDKT